MISPTSSAGQTSGVVPGSWRTIAASRTGTQVTALVAILGRVRRLPFAEPKLSALREALAKQPGVPTGSVSFRVAADPDGNDEVLSDEQLARLVRAGRPLHVLQEEQAPPFEGVLPGDGASSVDSTVAAVVSGSGSQIADDEKTSAELKEVRNLLQELYQEEAQLAAEVLRERQRSAALETSIEELRQRVSAELTLEREAREAGEGELRHYADSLHGTALGVVTRLEQQLAGLQVQVEEEMRARARSAEEPGAGLHVSSDGLQKVIDTQVGETLQDIERQLRKGLELMLTDKIEVIERNIRQDLLDSSRAAHAELRAALDASRLLAEQQDAKRHGELEATLVQRFLTIENSIRKVEHSNTEHTGHLKSMVTYVAAIQQDATRHETEIKEVQQSVRELKQRTRAAVEGTLGLLAEAHSEKDHVGSSSTPSRSQSPLRAESALGALAPLTSLTQLSKPLDLLPGLPEMMVACSVDDDGDSSCSRRSLQGLMGGLFSPQRAQSPVPADLAAAAGAVQPPLPQSLATSHTSTPVNGGSALRNSPPTASREAMPKAASAGGSSPVAAEAPKTLTGPQASQLPGRSSARSSASSTALSAAALGLRTRRSPAAESAGTLRGMSSDSAPVREMRVPSNDTVYSNRSLPAHRRDARSPPGAPTASNGAYAPPTNSPNVTRPQRGLGDGAAAATTLAAATGALRSSTTTPMGLGARGDSLWHPKTIGLSAPGVATTKSAW